MDGIFLEWIESSIGISPRGVYPPNNYDIYLFIYFSSYNKWVIGRLYIYDWGD